MSAVGQLVRLNVIERTGDVLWGLSGLLLPFGLASGVLSWRLSRSAQATPSDLRDFPEFLCGCAACIKVVLGLISLAYLF